MSNEYCFVIEAEDDLVLENTETLSLILSPRIQSIQTSTVSTTTIYITDNDG